MSSRPSIPPLIPGGEGVYRGLVLASKVTLDSMLRLLSFNLVG